MNYVKQGHREIVPLALFLFLDLKTILESVVPELPCFSPVHSSDINTVRQESPRGRPLVLQVSV